MGLEHEAGRTETPAVSFDSIWKQEWKKVSYFKDSAFW